MSIAAPDIVTILPEIILLGMTCIVVLFAAFAAEKLRLVTYSLVQGTLIAVLVILALQYSNPTELTFHGMLVLDKLTKIMQFAMVILTFFIFLFSRSYLQESKMPRSEFYILGMLSLLGMMILVAANNLITLYLGLELFSLPSIAMVALQRDSAISAEAAIKYFVVSALASGILLFGFSFLYGITGSLNLMQIARAIPSLATSQYAVLLLSMVFVVIGISFKLGAVPFHMWLPDVYAGAANPVTLFISTAPKIAGLGMAIRLLVTCLPSLAAEWQGMLIVIAVLSIGLGNLVAIAQSNFKRMLAYSSIAHMGYMTLGLIAATSAGYGSAVFYAIIYAAMSLGGFAILVILSRNGVDIENISDLKGLNSRSPWLAFMLLLVLFSMAGIPPLAGFFAKVGVIEALIGVHLVWLSAYAIVFAVIGCYYYIRVVKVMYFEEPTETTPIVYAIDARLAISVSGLFVLLLGIFPGWLFTMCRAAFGM